MMLRADFPRRNEYSLAKDLRITKRLVDRNDATTYVRNTYPNMPQGKQENLVTALMAASGLDDGGTVQSAEVSSKVRLVN